MKEPSHSNSVGFNEGVVRFRFYIVLSVFFFTHSIYCIFWSFGDDRPSYAMRNTLNKGKPASDRQKVTIPF